MHRRIFLKTALGASAAALGAGTRSLAQTAADAARSYPARMVRIVVPFSAGSMTDILARSVAEKLADKWKQQVIVENKPGIAGTASVTREPPDGHTLMLTSNGHTVLAMVNRSLTFDPVKDFAGISQVASTPCILIVPPEAQTRTVKDLIEAARAKPKGLNYS